MSIVDRAFRQQATQSVELPTMRLREAAVAFLVGSVASDGAVTSEEAARVPIPSMKSVPGSPRASSSSS